MDAQRVFRRAAQGTLVYNLGVVAWGALVRATGSGAGCGSHWPDCNGEIVPTAPALKTVIEFGHRATSGIDGALAIGLLIGAYLAFPRGHRARTGAGLFMGSMVLEAFFGALLVKLGLVESNDSGLRAAALAIHQVVTFYLFAALVLTVLWSGGLGAMRTARQGLVGLAAGAALAALPVLAVTGAIAALGDTLFPAGTLSAGMHADFSPTAHFLLRLRVLHPVIAVLCAGLVGGSAWTCATLRPAARVRAAAWTVGACFAAQLAVGLVNLVLLAPVPMQLVHLLFADLTWLAVVRLAAVTLAQPVPELGDHRAAATA